MSGSLAIIAGGGVLPRHLIDGCRALGRPVFVVAIKGETEPATVADVPHRWLDLAAVGQAVAAMREAGCAEVCILGPVRRPDFAALRPDWEGMKLLPRVLAAAKRGDDAILSVLVRYLEETGFRVVGAEDVLTRLAVPAGTLGRHAPTADDRQDIAKGLAVIRALGPHDVGQAAVVRAGRVLAVEAAEGTDRMLARCAEFAEAAPAGVLVKCPKPAQERRVDLPTIGPATVAACRAARLAGIAIAAGQTLVVEREAAVREADAHGLFIVAVDVGTPP